MSRTVAEILDTILDFHVKWKSPVSQLLNDALDVKEIEMLFQAVGLAPTAELLDLYQWRNGTKVATGTILDDVQLIPGFHFLSLQDSIRHYKAMKGNQQWNLGWFPVFANGGGDFYAVDLSQTDGEKAPIIGFMLDEDEQDIEYQSLTAMLLTFCECFENGIVFRTKEGYLEMDDDKQADVALKNNPDVEFWQN